MKSFEEKKFGMRALMVTILCVEMGRIRFCRVFGEKAARLCCYFLRSSLVVVCSGKDEGFCAVSFFDSFESGLEIDCWLLKRMTALSSAAPPPTSTTTAITTSSSAPMSSSNSNTTTTATTTSGYLGITPPLSLNHPTPGELKSTDLLQKTLRDLHVFEGEEESKRREEVLSQLNLLVKEFVRSVALQRNLPDAIASEAGGKIFTFGSYRLGVHSAGT